MSAELTFQELTLVPCTGPVRCIRCGREETFTTPREAHDASWDVAQHFSFQPVCPACPYGAWVTEFVDVKGSGDA
jgi:hypothetical protein